MDIERRGEKCQHPSGWTFPFIPITLERNGKTVCNQDGTPLIIRREFRLTEDSCSE